MHRQQLKTFTDTHYRTLYINTLSQSHSAVVLEALKLYAKHTAGVLADLNILEATTFPLCNLADADAGAEHFKTLNRIRTSKRKVRRDRYLAQEATTVLKRQAKTHTSVRDLLGIKNRRQRGFNPTSVNGT